MAVRHEKSNEQKFNEMIRKKLKIFYKLQMSTLFAPLEPQVFCKIMLEVLIPKKYRNQYEISTLIWYKSFLISDDLPKTET